MSDFWTWQSHEILIKSYFVLFKKALNRRWVSFKCRFFVYIGHYPSFLDLGPVNYFFLNCGYWLSADYTGLQKDSKTKQKESHYYRILDLVIPNFRILYQTLVIPCQFFEVKYIGYLKLKVREVTILLTLQWRIRESVRMTLF